MFDTGKHHCIPQNNFRSTGLSRSHKPITQYTKLIQPQLNNAQRIRVYTFWDVLYMRPSDAYMRR